MGELMFQSNSEQFTRSEHALNTKMMFFTKPTHGIVNSLSHKIQYRKILDKPVFQGPG